MYIADVALENSSTWFAIFFPYVQIVLHLPCFLMNIFLFKFYGSLEDPHCFKYILKRSTWYS